MSPARSDPQTSMTPLDLSDRALRDQVSAGAARAFINFVACWQFSDEDACELPGIGNGAMSALKASEGLVLDEAQLTRISYLVGIFSALNIIFMENIADRWLRLPNTNPLFAGSSPIDYMIRHGLPAFAAVRRLLDARVVGE